MVGFGLEFIVIPALLGLSALFTEEGKPPPVQRSDPNVFNVLINSSTDSSNKCLQFIKVNILPSDPKSSYYEMKEWKIPHLSKSILIASSSMAVWLGVVVKLLLGSYQAKRADTWGAWKETIPEEVLQELPRNDLAREILLSIAQRYHIEKTESNDLIIFSQFFHDIEMEFEYLQSFINQHEWLSSHYLRYLFPAQEIALELAALKIKRLNFLRSLMLPHLSPIRSTIHEA